MKATKAGNIIDHMKKLAPETDMQNGDNAGLQAGSAEKAVKKVMVTLDVTPEVVEEAVKKDIDLIISHHPVILQPQNNLSTDNPRGRMLATLLKNDITVYTAHTSLDVAINGVSDVLCGKFNLENADVLKITAEEKCYKLVTCIPVLPEDYTARIRTVLGDFGTQRIKTGLGIVGNYSHVCDYTKGIQNFIPLENTNPFIGKQGVLESVEVDRLEIIVPESMLDEAIEKLLEVHPYEEVEYDVYPIMETRNPRGYGRTGSLPEEKSLPEIIDTVKRALGVSIVKAAGDTGKAIKKIAVCGGAGGSLIREACEKGCDLYITGDLSYHDGQLAKELGIALIDAGHWATEFPVVSYIKEYLESSMDKDGEAVEFIVSNTITEPFRYV